MNTAAYIKLFKLFEYFSEYYYACICSPLPECLKRGQIYKNLTFIMFYIHVWLSKTDNEYKTFTVMVTGVIHKVF